MSKPKVLKQGVPGVVGNFTCWYCQSLLEVHYDDIFGDYDDDEVFLIDGPFCECPVCKKTVKIKVPYGFRNEEMHVQTRKAWRKKHSPRNRRAIKKKKSK